MAQKKGGSRRRTATTAKKQKTEQRDCAEKRQSAAEQPLFLREEALPLLFGLLAVLLLLGNFGLCGALGAVLRDVQLGLFGSPGLLFPLLLCGIVIYSLLSGDKERAARKNTALLLSYVFLIVLYICCRGQRAAISPISMPASGAAVPSAACSPEHFARFWGRSALC